MGILWNAALQCITKKFYGIQLYWVLSGNFVEFSSTGYQMGILWNSALLDVKWECFGIQLYRVSNGNVMEYLQGVMWQFYEIQGVKWESCGIQLYRMSIGNFMEYNFTGCQVFKFLILVTVSV